MQIGFEFEAAQNKKRDTNDEPLRETMRGSRKITNAPSTDQKKVRRAMNRGKKAELEQREAGGRVPTNPAPMQQQQQQQPGAQQQPMQPASATPGPSPVACPTCQGTGQAAPNMAQVPGQPAVQPIPQQTICMGCQGQGQDYYGRPCGRCRGTGAHMSMTSALDDSSSKECRLCGGNLNGVGTNTARCEDCGTEHNVQPKSQEKSASLHSFRSAIARRSADVLNTPEEK